MIKAILKNIKEEKYEEKEMGRKVKNKIIDDKNLLTKEEILSYEFNETNLYDMLKEENCLEFAARFRLIHNYFICKVCNVKMSIQKQLNYCLGHRWFCNICKLQTYPVTKDSYFSHCRKHFKKFIKVIFKYSKNNNMKDIANDLTINRKTIAEWFRTIIEAIHFEFLHTNTMLGGLNEDGTKKIVEIDESLFFKRKYQRGRIVNGTWYVGGVERNSNKAFLTPVLNRNSDTLKKIISEYIRENTLIITDEWRAYKSAINQLTSFEHRTINHTLNFVSPNDVLIHTQQIEGMWSLLKQHLRNKRGISPDDYFFHMIDYLWKKKKQHKRIFNEIIILFSKF